MVLASQVLDEGICPAQLGLGFAIKQAGLGEHQEQRQFCALLLHRQVVLIRAAIWYLLNLSGTADGQWAEEGHGVR